MIRRVSFCSSGALSVQAAHSILFVNTVVSPGCRSSSFHLDNHDKIGRQVPDPHTVVTINHLKSYEHMGQAGASAVIYDATF